MSSITLSGGQTQLALLHTQLALRVEGEPVQTATYEDASIAAIAFEANAEAMERRGAVHTEARLGSLEEALAPFPHSVKCKRRGGEPQWRVLLRDLDPVAHEDGLAPRTRRAPALGAFDPEAPLSPGGVSRHVLRRLAATQAQHRLFMELAGRFIDPALDSVARYGLGRHVQTLKLYDVWDREAGRPRPEARDLVSLLPALEHLEVPWWSWPMWGKARHARLKRVRLSRAWLKLETPPVRPPQVIRSLSRQAPALTALQLDAPLTATTLTTLTQHRLPERLQHLDLSQADYGRQPRTTYRELLNRQPALAPLERITIRPPFRRSVRFKLQAWPAIRFEGASPPGS